jgi:hypothetical protein
VLGKILLMGGAGVVALGVVGDLAAKGFAEGKIAERAEAAAGEKASASADIDSFPFVLRLLTSGSAGDISLHVEHVATSTLELARVDLDLEGVQLDRGKLLSDRRAEVTDIDQGTITVGIDAEAVARALGGLPVTIRGNTVSVQVAGRTVTADVTVAAAGSIRVGVPRGPSATIGIPKTDLISCAGRTLSFEDDELRVSCTITEVPPALLRAAQQRLR